MRVVAGSARGMRLRAVPGQGTRPILDRVKTSLFDVLRPRIPGMDVLDLFAGSGSVGIQALSEGAASCTFTDTGHRAVVTIKENLAITGLAGRAEVRQTDAFGYLRATEKAFDLIYIAPPQYRNLWARAVRQIDERPELLRRRSSRPGEDPVPALAIVQIDPKEYESLELGELHETRQKRYGSTLLVFFEPAGVPTPESTADGGIGAPNS